MKSKFKWKQDLKWAIFQFFFIILCQISWVLIDMCQIYWLNHFHDFYYVSYFHILIICGTLACNMSILTKKKQNFWAWVFFYGIYNCKFWGDFSIEQCFLFRATETFFWRTVFFYYEIIWSKHGSKHAWSCFVLNLTLGTLSKNLSGPWGTCFGMETSWIRGKFECWNTNNPQILGSMRWWFQ